MCENENMAKRKRKSFKLPKFQLNLPKKKSDRRRVELLGGVAVTMTSVLVISIFFAASLQKVLLATPQMAAVVSSVLVELLNSDRRAVNLNELTVNPKLVEAAQLKANDMAAKGYFSHTTPEGHNSWYWFKKVGYDFEYAGENLAVDFSESADVERAWMQSPTHRANILQQHFTEVGIATAVGTYQGRTTVFAVQMFGSPARSNVAAPVRTVTPDVPPEETAIATTQQNAVAVLGEAAEKTAAVQEPEPVGALKSETPWWGYIVSSPQTAMQYAYYLLAALVLAALAIETGFEFRAHHTRRAIAAAFLLVLMTGAFFTADRFFFTAPGIDESGAMTAAAASAR